MNTMVLQYNSTVLYQAKRQAFFSILFFNTIHDKRVKRGSSRFAVANHAVKQVAVPPHLLVMDLVGKQLLSSSLPAHVAEDVEHALKQQLSSNANDSLPRHTIHPAHSIFYKGRERHELRMRELYIVARANILANRWKNKVLRHETGASEASSPSKAGGSRGKSLWQVIQKSKSLIPIARCSTRTDTVVDAVLQAVQAYRKLGEIGNNSAGNGTVDAKKITNDRAGEPGAPNPEVSRAGVRAISFALRGFNAGATAARKLKQTQEQAMRRVEELAERELEVGQALGVKTEAEMVAHKLISDLQEVYDIRKGGHGKGGHPHPLPQELPTLEQHHQQQQPEEGGGDRGLSEDAQEHAQEDSHEPALVLEEIKALKKEAIRFDPKVKKVHGI